MNWVKSDFKWTNSARNWKKLTASAVRRCVYTSLGEYFFRLDFCKFLTIFGSRFTLRRLASKEEMFTCLIFAVLVVSGSPRKQYYTIHVREVNKDSRLKDKDLKLVSDVVEEKHRLVVEVESLA